ncbi:MAG: cell division protein ZapA [Lachnospiraceae bacterium]|nr:cell division protein ZapA [Lachnospiraceae bacterium]
MQKRTEAEVIINGKRYQIVGIEEEEYLQKIATYLNGKYGAVKEIKGYKNMDLDMKEALVLINVADDYLKTRQQLADKQSELEQRETDIFNMKHDMLADRSRIKELEDRLEQLKAAQLEDQKKIVRLETELGNYRKHRNG